MKVYFHFNLGGSSNCYIIVNEFHQEAIIVDPAQVTEELIKLIEDNHLTLKGILVTHNHGSHVHGLKTLRKIYDPVILAADWEVAGNKTTVIAGDGKIRVGNTLVHYMSVPGHTADSMVYKVGNVMFTGDVISSGSIGSTTSTHSSFVLKNNIENKILSQTDSVVLFPGHGPPTSVGAAKQFNVDL